MDKRKLLLAAGAMSALIGGGLLYKKFGARTKKLGIIPNEDFLNRAIALIEAQPMIDTHAHPGRTFIRDANNTTLPLALRLAAGNRTHEDKAAIDMNKTGMSAVAFAGVADINVMGMKKGGGLQSAREFEKGEAFQSYRTQIANLKTAMAKNGVAIALVPDDVRKATKGNVKAILTMEGADFLEGKLERINEVYQDGLRSITIVHYRANEIGDIQTQYPVNGGLTKFGIEAIKEMVRLGIIIDLAHANEPTAFKALENLKAPVMLSHTHINGGPAGDFPRFVSKELALAVAKNGGIIGAWPTGMGINTLGGYVDRIIELGSIVGMDAICIGTDMDANYKPVVTKYTDLVLVISELLRRGITDADIIKFMGGNFIRMWDKVVKPI